MSNEESKSVEKKEVMKSAKSGFVLGLVAVLLIGIAITYGVTVNAVRNGTTHPTMVTLSTLFRVPIATVNGLKVSYADYVRDAATLRLFYTDAPEGFPEANDQDVSDQAISRLVVYRLIQDLAKDSNVTVSDDEILEIQKEFYTGFESQAEAEQQIWERFDWSLDEYTAFVLYPTALERNLRDDYLEKNAPAARSNEEVKNDAMNVLERIQNEESFEELAAEFGSDGTSQVGGDLGWARRGQMVEPFEEAIFNLEVGELSDELIETEFGYHIVRVDEKRMVTDEITEEEVEEVSSRHILFSFETEPDADVFDQYMIGILDAMEVKLFADINNPFENQEAVSDEGDTAVLE